MHAFTLKHKPILTAKPCTNTENVFTTMFLDSHALFNDLIDFLTTPGESIVDPSRTLTGVSSMNAFFFIICCALQVSIIFWVFRFIQKRVLEDGKQLWLLMLLKRKAFGKISKEMQAYLKMEWICLMYFIIMCFFIRFQIYSFYLHPRISSGVLFKFERPPH